MQRVWEQLYRVLRSRGFYLLVLAYFGFEALWIALSAAFPMAFDEDFHIGIIRLYSQQWLPFLSGQPSGADAYGAVAVDPSYLYHYLMSFPYRLVDVFSDNQMAQVIALRLLNIGLVGWALVLFRRLLLRAGSSPALTNVVLALFVLIPIVPLVAGQINYDSLFMVVVAAACLLVQRLTEQIAAKRLELTTLVQLVLLCLLGSLVKYAFLPLAVITAVYLAVLTWRTYRGSAPAFGRMLQRSYRTTTSWLKVALVVALVLAGGLFVQRYGANVVRHGTPLPSCEQALSVDRCMAYSPWARNYLYAQDKPNKPLNPNPLAYTWTWLQGMHYRLFFMITGPPTYTNYPPLLLPSAAIIGLALVATVMVVRYWRRVYRDRPFLVFLTLLWVGYVAVLWLQNYGDFLATAEPVAINGRYLLPLLLPTALVLGRGLQLALARWPRAKVWLAAAALICCLQGGGLATFVLRSDDSWYWPNPTVIQVNHAAQRLLDPFILQSTAR